MSDPFAWHTAKMGMDTNKLSICAAFQALAQQYPDCSAVKLTLELQRGFIRIQQDLIDAALLLLVAENAASIIGTELQLSPVASGSDLPLPS